MVVLPPEFVATMYPGYFWNTETKILFSIKVTGELKQLAFCRGGNFYGHIVKPGYRISHNGERRNLPMEYLCTLRPVPEQQVIGVVNGRK